MYFLWQGTVHEVWKGTRTSIFSKADQLTVLVPYDVLLIRCCLYPMTQGQYSSMVPRSVYSHTTGEQVSMVGDHRDLMLRKFTNECSI